MDAELQAFRSEWRRDVERAQRAQGTDETRTASKAERVDAGDAPGAHLPAPRVVASMEHDALAALVAALTKTHEQAVRDLAAQNTLEYTAWPEHVGACTSTMYAADPELGAPVAQRIPDEVWHTILLHVLAPQRLETSWPSMLHENMSFQPPPVPWRPASGPDYVSLERIGRTCWRLRKLSANPLLWRMAVQMTYVEPLAPITALPSCSWRDAFVHEPRVRMNGTYIATCQYTQQGMSEENVWVRVLHVVEFFRYLRFFPNGRCLSWLTTERPDDVVHCLKPGIRAKGCAAGRWRCLPDAGSPPARRGATIVMEDLHDPTLPGYTFQMTLHMRSSPGRWHRLDVVEYASLNLHTGEVLPIPHKHARPFLFSRVLSYGV